jgi:hypothetical protein
MSPAGETREPPSDEDRKQLILAQVEILELEDVRDDLTSRLATTQELLTQCQALADEKLDALEHLKRVHAALETEFRHFRHVQHVTNEALNETRAQLAATETAVAALRTEAAAQAAALAGTRAEHPTTQAALTALRAEDAILRNRLATLDAARRTAESLAAEHLARIQVLDTERRALVTSRSWRFTAPLRSLERAWARLARP